MGKTFQIYLFLIIIYLITGYTIPTVKAETKETDKPAVTEAVSEDIKEKILIEPVTNDENNLSLPAEAVEDEGGNKTKTEVEKSSGKNKEVKSSHEIEEEETETKLEEVSKKIHEIIIPEREKLGNSQFQPEVLTVKINEKIMWINEDSRTHFIGTMVIEEYPTGMSEVDDDDDEDDEEEEEDDFKLPEHYFTSGVLAKGDQFEHSFDTPGTYIYYCFTHPMEMRGTIIVVADE